MIPLETWAASIYDPPPDIKKLRQWAREGQIHPPPEKTGHVWYVWPNARRMNTEAPRQSLVQRLAQA